MARVIDPEFFYIFKPIMSYADYFPRRQFPAVRALCQASSSRIPGDASRAWMEGARLFPEEFECAANLTISDDSIKMHRYIDDPFKLMGLSRESLSEGTFQAAWWMTRRVVPKTAALRLRNLLHLVKRSGMATDTDLAASRWLAGGESRHWRVGGLRTWPGAVFGYYASAWSQEDLQWLISSGLDPDAFISIILGLIGNGEGVLPPKNGLPFHVVRTVYEEGLTVEYARELFSDALV